LIFDMGASVADYDTFMLSGSNFGSHSDSVQFYIGSDDNSSFSSPSGLISAFTVTDSARRVYFMSSRHAERYVALSVLSDAALVPEIGELWLGRRRHLPYKFDRLLDDKRTGSELVAFESRSGIRANYTLSRGQSRRTGSMLLDQASDVATVEAFWAESAQGYRLRAWAERAKPVYCRLLLAGSARQEVHPVHLFCARPDRRQFAGAFSRFESAPILHPYPACHRPEVSANPV
jgi:hypothetical protein